MSADTLSLTVHFRQNSSRLDTLYMHNSQNMREFAHRVRLLSDSSAISVRSIHIVAGASPEGRVEYNRSLARKRSAHIRDFLSSLNELDGILLDVQPRGVDWEVLTRLIEEDDRVPYRAEVLRLIQRTPEVVTFPDGRRFESRKMKLVDLRDGEPYRYLYHNVFPKVRSSSVSLVCEFVSRRVPDELAIAPLPEVRSPFAEVGETVLMRPQMPATEFYRRPLLAVKTNLLADFAPYIPGYGWAPLPNVALEYFPRRGHFTVLASLDIPWWINQPEHKFLEARNYQLEARWYRRGADGIVRGSGRSAAYSGFFAYAYAHACLYAIGFPEFGQVASFINTGKPGAAASGIIGIEGEGVGAGLGIGYALPVSRNGHWKLEFSLQAGYFYTGYDPYVYGDPVNGNINGLYYYNWTGRADDFRPRLYRQSWFGPTRAGISISYDLIKRKKEVRR